MPRKLIPHTVVSVLALGLFAGCAAQDVGLVGEQPREAITYAARAKYPGAAQQSDRYKSVAIVNPDRKILDVYNLSTQTIPATAIWVNGAFVKQIAPIAPKGHVSTKYVELLEAGPGARSFSQIETPVQKVELQTNDGNYAVQGPVNR
jgi:hypothetical protein